MGEQRGSKADDSTVVFDQHLQQVALALYGILPQIHRLHFPVVLILPCHAR
jgi:hypothetical protein